jgi:flagellar hook-length control protein FliK
MQSGQVNASQLLAAFLGNAKEKLGQAITKNDFSGELAKHFPQQSATAAIAAGDGAAELETQDSNSGSNASARQSAVFAESKAGASTSKPNNAPVGNKGVNARALEEKKLVISNPAVLQSVLANLHYPAEIRDRAEKLLSKQGNLSIQDLKSILAAGAAGGSSQQAQVPAQAVRALVASVTRASGNVRENASGIAKDVKSAVAVKPKGVYSLRELGKLLDRVVQASQKESLKTQPLATSGSTPPVVEKKTGAGLKKGQTRELVSSVLPSFISEVGKVSPPTPLSADAGAKSLQVQEASVENEKQAGQDQGTAALGQNAESVGEAGSYGPSVGDGAGAEANVKAAADGGAKKALSAAEVVPETVLGDKTDGSSQVNAAAQLADLLKAGMAATKAAPELSAASPADNSLEDVQNRAQLGGQDTPMLAKHIEKSTGLEERSVENVVSHSTGDNPAGNAINLPQMDNSSSGGFVFYDRNQAAQTAQTTRGTGAGNASATGMDSILASYISTGEESSDKQEQANNAASVLTAREALDSTSSATGSAASQQGLQTGGALESSVPGSVFAAAGDDIFSAMEQLVLGARMDASTAKADGDTLEAKVSKTAGETSTKDASNNATSAQTGTDKTAKVSAETVQALKATGPTSSVPGSSVSEQGLRVPALQTGGSLATAGGKVADNSAQGFVTDASNTATSAQAGTDKASAVALGGAPTAGPVANAASQVSASASIDQQVALSGPDDSGGQGAQAGSQTGSSSGSYATAGASATSAKNVLTAMEQVALGGRSNTSDAKRMEDPGGTMGSPSNAALLQAGATPSHAINMPLADNSTQSGFAPYDPYRAIELANSVQEQMRGGVGGQLVLEMEPEGLGKINLKVKAKKDEISVEAMTQSEPAKQALMNHSVELRQALKTQGLDLGKFMVDVNGGNPGGKNGAQSYQSGGNSAGSSGAAKVPADTTLEGSVPAVAATGGSRISVFA